VQEIILPFRPNYDIFPPSSPQKSSAENWA